MLTLRLLAAFFRRDALSNLSYRLGFFLDLLSILFSVATFYYVSKLFGAQGSAAMAAYGGDYFAFVLIGIAFSAYQGVGLHSFAQSIRQEQYLGTLESVLSAPVGVRLFLLASAQWDFFYATIQVALYLAVGAVVFGLRFPAANIPAALGVLALTLAAFMSLGMLSAAFILRFKRGDPVSWAIGTASELLGGVYFPVAVLPPWLRGLSRLVPMTHALEGLRETLLRGATFSDVRASAAVLAAFSAVFLPLGVVCFRWALEAARREGSLGHY